MAEFRLRLSRETVSEQFFSEFDVKAGVSARLGAREALLRPTADLRIDLAESVFLVVPLDALRQHFHRSAARNNRASRRVQRLQ